MTRAHAASAGVLTTVLIAITAVPASAVEGDGQWYIAPYQIREFHDQGTDGRGVTVAVVDSAIYLDAPQLQGADIWVKEPSQCYGPDGQEQSSESDDPALALHGTNAVSYIVGNGTSYDGKPGILGIAPKAKVLFYSVRAQDGCYSASGLDPAYSSVVWDEMVSTAVIDATDQGADIITFSISSGGATIEPALAYAMRHGVIVVASLSNQESSTNLADNVDGYPAVNNGVIGVGDLGPDWTRPLNGMGDPSTSNDVDVVAPGVDVWIQGSETDWHDLSLGEGTSIATPIVAGVLALAIQKYPGATHDQIIQSLIHNTGNTSHDLVYDSDHLMGYGIVNPVMLLAADPAQYDDVNPLLSRDDSDGPSFDEVYGTEATPTPTPSATATPGPPTDTPTPSATDTGGSNSNLLLIVGAVLVVALIAIVIVIVIAAPKRSTPGH